MTTDNFTKEKTVENDTLNALGKKADYQFSTEPATQVLETFESPFPRGTNSCIQMRMPEFTSLCPKTGQPDFAEIYIEYEPRSLCVESKSLKLYLMSFRMVGEFHESCVNRIYRDLDGLLDPMSLFVQGRFTPRGGIPFWPERGTRAAQGALL